MGAGVIARPGSCRFSSCALDTRGLALARPVAEASRALLGHRVRRALLLSGLGCAARHAKMCASAYLALVCETVPASASVSRLSLRYALPLDPASSQSRARTLRVGAWS